MTISQQDDASVIEFLPALELKFLSGDTTGEFSGHAAAFGNIDSHQDVIRPGAFAASIASHKAAGTMPPLLWSHNQAKPVGKILALSEDQKGLLIHGKLNLSTTAGRDAYGHVKGGDTSGMSIGYQVPPGGLVHGRNGVRTLQRLSLHEVSIVTLPSNEFARISEVKSVKTLASAAELERLLRDAGLSRRAAERIAAGGFPALTKSAPDEIENKALARLLNEQARQITSWS